MAKSKHLILKDLEYEIEDKDVDRISERKTAISLDAAARSIADSIKALAQATQLFDPTKDGAIEATLKKQVELLSKLVENISTMAKHPPVVQESVQLKEWTVDIERNATVEFQDGTVAKGFISKAFLKQTKG